MERPDRAGDWPGVSCGVALGFALIEDTLGWMTSGNGGKVGAQQRQRVG